MDLAARVEALEQEVHWLRSELGLAISEVEIGQLRDSLGLTYQEAKILAFLYGRRGRPASYLAIDEAVPGYVERLDPKKQAAVRVSCLRRVLGADAIRRWPDGYSLSQTGLVRVSDALREVRAH